MANKLQLSGQKRGITAGQAVGGTVGAAAGAAGGASAGLTGGAALGTFLLPGVGTAIGGALGAIGGGIMGALGGGATGASVGNSIQKATRDSSGDTQGGLDVMQRRLAANEQQPSPDDAQAHVDQLHAGLVSLAEVDHQTRQQYAPIINAGYQRAVLNKYGVS